MSHFCRATADRHPYSQSQRDGAITAACTCSVIHLSFLKKKKKKQRKKQWWPWGGNKEGCCVVVIKRRGEEGEIFQSTLCCFVFSPLRFSFNLLLMQSFTWCLKISPRQNRRLWHYWLNRCSEKESKTFCWTGFLSCHLSSWPSHFIISESPKKQKKKGKQRLLYLTAPYFVVGKGCLCPALSPKSILLKHKWD